jgi:hypothetical protein
MQKRASKLIRIAVRAQQAAKYVLPEHSSKFSRKDFTQHQLLAIAVLKQKTDEDYRDTVDGIGSDLMQAMNLVKIPHFTTLQKFIKRLGSQVLDELIAVVAILVIGDQLLKGATVGIDSSGYPASHASSYFVRRIKRKPTHKTFLKGSFIGDLTNQVIVCCKLRNFPSHDIIDFKRLLERALAILKKISEVHADKAYDGKDEILLVEKLLKAVPYIKIKETDRHKCKSRIRRRVLNNWNRLCFSLRGRQRNLIETINSVVKRVFGDALYSKGIWMRRKELKLKYFAYNVYRSVQLEEFFCCLIVSWT